jgi:L-ascorbate metabolism protein UlaG (beta-lactamase superfamily)
LAGSKKVWRLEKQLRTLQYGYYLDGKRGNLPRRESGTFRPVRNRRYYLSGRENYYITGDTLYNERVFESLPHEEIELLFLPINGEGNNMNFEDGKKFAERVKAKKVVPIHLGLLDDKNAESWAVENKILPNIYQEIAY